MLALQLVPVLIAGGFLWYYYGFPFALLVIFAWSSIHLAIGILYVRWIRYRPTSMFHDKEIATKILNWIEMADYHRKWDDSDEAWSIVIVGWPAAIIMHLFQLIDQLLKALGSFLMSLTRKNNGTCPPE